MENTFRKISLRAVFVAMALLMAEMLVPHHHCEGIMACDSSLIGAMHFGYESCDCCDEGHSHGEEFCCYTTRFYCPNPSDNDSFEKKIISSVFYFLLQELDIVCADRPGSAGGNQLYAFKIPDIGLSAIVLRGPPVA